MKTRLERFGKPSLVLAFTCLCASIATPQSAAQEMKPAKVKVQKMRGEVVFKAVPTDAWKPVRKGMTLKPGAVVRADKPGMAHIVVQDDLTANLWFSGQLALEKMTYGKMQKQTQLEVALDLQVGTIIGRLAPRASNSTITVKFPNGTYTIMAQGFKAHANGVLSIGEGSAQVNYRLSGQEPLTVAMTGWQTFYPPYGDKPHRLVASRSPDRFRPPADDFLVFEPPPEPVIVVPEKDLSPVQPAGKSQ